MRKPCGTCKMPVHVLRTMGSSAYTNSATSAGTVPIMPSTGIKIASKASEGTVCSTPTKASTVCRSGAENAASTPSGMPIRHAKATDNNTRVTCWRVRVHKSSPMILSSSLPRAAAG
ncbi:hypothetical protein D3C72_1658230 [compost metagenome]